VAFEFIPQAVPDVVLVRPRVLGDARGFFAETWKRDEFAAGGIAADFVQDNHARSSRKGVLRGLHFQRAPHAQAKLLRCVRGRVLDVAVDIRRGSPTFGRHVAVELSDENHAILFVPRGLAHGYLTLTDEADVLYKVDAPYAAQAEGGLAWNDPDVGIAWPVADPVLSERDRRWPRLRDLP